MNKKKKRRIIDEFLKNKKKKTKIKKQILKLKQENVPYEIKVLFFFI